MASLDIVELIENNPITRLSGTYNSKLLNKIKESFNETEQQLFVASFYCFLNYQKNDFVIDLDNIWEWLGFHKKCNAKRVLEKHFKLNVDYKSSYLNLQEQEKTHGGSNKEKIMMNVKTFKLFCLKSCTAKADQIHEYYITLEETLQDVIQEETTELKKQLEIRDNEFVEYKNFLKEKGLEKEKRLVSDFHSKNVVYVFLIQNIGDALVIKIGATQSIKERKSNLSNSFTTEILLIDVIQSDNYMKFEKFLHNNDFIKKFNYPVEMKNGNKSSETYLVDKKQYEEFVKIIQENKKNFQNTDIEREERAIKLEELVVQGFKIQQENLLLNLELQKQGVRIEPVIIPEIEENIVDEDVDDEPNTPNTNVGDITTCNFSMVKRDTGKRSPKVYQYNIEDLTNPIRIHDSPIDVERAFEGNTITPSALKCAAENNTIYKDFRWYFVRHDETVPDTIPDTVATRQLAGFQLLAMIDITKTKIMKVYASQKDAVEARMMKCNGFTRAIKQESISSGHYWKYYKDCSEEMKNEYLSRETLPEKIVSKSAKSVEQIDPRTRQIIKTHHSSREVTKDFQMSIASLKKASASGEIKNGYIWRINE
jgi:T5orf172 domain